MVPVEVPEKVPEVGEVKTTVNWAVPEPEASAKRPVPPVMVKEAVAWNTLGLEVGQKTSLAELKSSSPFAAVVVSCSAAVNPPHSDVPVSVLEPTNVVFPRCVSWPVPVIATLVVGVVDVTVKLPATFPFKGLECEAKATGNAPSNTRTARIAGIRVSLFILF